MKKNERYFYPAVFAYSGDGKIQVSFPDFKCSTSGSDECTAFLSAKELLGFTLYGMEREGCPVPEPTPLSGVSLEPNERSVLVDVYMPTVRMAQKNRSVNRTVTLPAWLNAAALEHDINFSQVLQDTLKEYLQLDDEKRRRK